MVVILYLNMEVMPIKLLTFEDVERVDKLLSQIIQNLQNINDENCLAKLKNIEAIQKIISDTLKALQRCTINPGIDNIINKITDILMIANDAGKIAKTIIVKSLTENCLDLILCQTLSLLHKMEILKSMNIVLKNCPFLTKHELLLNSTISEKITLAVGRLKHLGDYEYQVCIIEYFFRLVPKSLRVEFTQNITGSNNFCLELLNISDNKFETDCRLFLNKLNLNCSDQSKRIFSIPALSVKINGTKIYKPSDEGYDEFWLDFNTGSKRIGIFCEPNFLSSQQTQDEELWETISIWAKDVNTYHFSEKEGQKIATIELLPCSQLLGSKKDEQSHLVIITVSQDHDLLHALESTFKSEIKASSVDVPLLIKGKQNSPRFEELAKQCTPFSLLSISSFKSKVSVPMSPMKSPAHSLISTNCNINAVKKPVLKKRKEKKVESPVEKIAVKNCSDLVTNNCNKNFYKDFEAPSAATIRTLRSGKKVKTPVVCIQPMLKNKQDILDNGKGSGKIQSADNSVSHKGVKRLKNKINTDKLRKRQKLDDPKISLKNKNEDFNADRKREKINKGKSIANDVTFKNNIKICESKYCSPGNVSINDFKDNQLNKTKKSLKNSEVSTSISKADPPQDNKVIEQHPNNISAEGDKCTSSKKNANDIDKIREDCQTLKIHNSNKKLNKKSLCMKNNNDSLLVKTQIKASVDVSPLSFSVSSLKSGDLYIETEKIHRQDSNEVIAETQSQKSPLHIINVKRATINCKNEKNMNKSSLFFLEQKENKQKIKNNIDDSENIVNSFVFTKSEANNSLINSEKQGRLYKKELREQEITEIQPSHNLRARKKIISYKESNLSDSMDNFSEKEVKSVSSKLEKKAIKKKYLADQCTNLCKEDVTARNYSLETSSKIRFKKNLKVTQEIANDNFLKPDICVKKGQEITKSAFIHKPEDLHHKIWTSQRIEKTITTMSFSGVFPKGVSDPYDFDAECSEISEKKVIQPDNSLKKIELSSHTSMIKTLPKIKNTLRKPVSFNKKKCKQKKENKFKEKKSKELNIYERKEKNDFFYNNKRKELCEATLENIHLPSYCSQLCSISIDSPQSTLINDKEKGQVKKDSISSSPYSKESSELIFPVNTKSVGSELSWLKPPPKEVISKSHSKTYETKLCETKEQKKEKSSLFLEAKERINPLDKEDCDVKKKENKDIKGCKSKKSYSDHFISPFDLTSGLKSGPSSVQRPSNSELKRNYSTISSDSNKSDHESERDDDELKYDTIFRPKKLFKTDFSPEKSVKMISQRVKEDNKKKREAEYNSTLKKINYSKESRFNFASPKKVKNIGTLKREKEKELSHEKSLSSFSASKCLPLHLNGETKSRNSCLKYEPAISILNKEKKNVFSLTQDSETTSELSDESIESNSNKANFMKTTAEQRKSLPSIDDSLQDVLECTRKCLHSAWDSKQNVTAAKKFQILTKELNFSLMKNLKDFEETELKTLDMWKQIMAKFKANRINQETELQRLKQAHGIIDADLLHCENQLEIGKKILHSTLKQDMNELQKKIFNKINENSLQALKRCLISTVMIS